MRDHLKAFLQYLKLNRHLSPHTVRAYDSDVTQYLAFVAAGSGKKMSELQPLDLDMRSARAHVAGLNSAGKARSSVARKLSALKTFVRYLRREEVIDHDPTAMAVAPRRDHTIPVFLSEPEMTRLIETPNTGDPLGRRDRAILELFYASGLRLSELVAVDLEDVNLSGRMVRVMGKGRKERLLPFNQSAADAIRAWMKDRAQILAGRRRQKAEGRRRQAEGRRQKRPVVYQLPRYSPQRPQRRSPAPQIRGAVQHAPRHQPARAAPFVCHAFVAARRRPARHPGAARSRGIEHDAAIHARQCRATDRRLPQIASARHPPPRLKPLRRGRLLRDVE
jgi:site-specific recombinase XerD